MAVWVLTNTCLDARAALPPGNAVQQWNQIAEDTVVSAGAFQNEGLIYMAYVSAAVYNAVAAIEGSYQTYRFNIAADRGASIEAAVVEAAYVDAPASLPGRRRRRSMPFHVEALALIPEGGAKDDGRAIGVAAAQAIIALRAEDGRITPIGATSAFPTKPPGPGVWRLTPPAFAAPQTPWVGSVQPFVLSNPHQFRPAPPPLLTSQRWVEEFNEIRDAWVGHERCSKRRSNCGRAILDRKRDSAIQPAGS